MAATLLYIVLVMTGMHLPVIMAIAVTYFTVGHEDVVLLSGGCATMAVAGMCLGVFFKAKQQQNRTLSFSCFTANFLGGVSEPAIYGIMLEYKRTWIYQMIGAAAAGFVARLLKIGVYTITSGANIIGWMGFAGGSSQNLIGGCIVLAIAFAIPFVLTMIFGFGEDKVEKKAVAAL